MRNKLKYFFASKKLLLAQLADLQRQLQEAWHELDVYRNIEWGNDYLREQLHRVARERDECYRQKRLADIRRKKDNG